MPRFCAILAVPLALGAVATHGAEPAREKLESGNTTSAGMRAYIDPQTKTLTSPPETDGAAKHFIGMRAPDFSRIRQEVLNDGTVLLHPNGQFRMVSVVRREADGSFASTCEPLPASDKNSP